MNFDINQAIVPHIKNQYESIDQVAESLTALEELFRSTKDNRGIFVVAYKAMTDKLVSTVRDQETGETQTFENLAWIKKYLVIFADFYRKSLYGHIQGRAIPKVWQFAFEKAENNKGVISLQHLMLGINAHIVHDLPLTLDRIGIDLASTPQLKSMKTDHDKVNQVLAEATNQIQNKVTRFQASQGYSILEKIIGPLDEWVAKYYFEQQRERAWYNGLHLNHLAQAKVIDGLLSEWFEWALQSRLSINSLDDLKQQIDSRALYLAENVVWLRLPNYIPGFKEGEDQEFDQFEPNEDLKQWIDQIESRTESRDVTAAEEDWTQII